MGTGYLRVQCRTGDGMLPVDNAHVTIKNSGGAPLYETDTDSNGSTETYPLPAPDVMYTLDPNYMRPAYTVYTVDISAEGFVTMHIQGVEVVDTQIAILPVRMEPLVEEPNPVTNKSIEIPPVGLLIAGEHGQTDFPDPVYYGRVVTIPSEITVHLGIPSNTAARNVRVNFIDYIKNVVSSEIYSTWPVNSLLANIHVIVTFALNRIYTEWYRSRDFNFDITNSTAYDQHFRDGGPVFENISKIVDNYFNSYAHRIGFQNPFFTQYCNGTTVTCPGLSQWGTVDLANQGYEPLEILHYYYPNDLTLTYSDNIVDLVESFPGSPLRVGSEGNPVRRMQNSLNRIRVNFPLIPLISNPNGIFGTDMEDAVRTFQRTFNLTPDGVIGRATWNKISFIYVGVIRLAELDSEGERITIGLNPPDVVLSQGSTGANVLELQFILNSISPYYPTVPTVIKDGVFGAAVKNAVIEFQKTFNLTPDGIVNAGTWNKLYEVYRSVHDNAPIPPAEIPSTEGQPQYPGTPLTLGATGPAVRLMQTYLNTIRIVYTNIPYHEVNGEFDEAMRRAVIAFQEEFVLTPDGVIGPVTWNEIEKQFLLVTANASVSLEYPGTPLRLGSTGSEVRLMQGFLVELRSHYPNIPLITVDGIFGPLTQAAVIAFQNQFGLTADGIIGPVTWAAIIEQRNAVV